MKSLVGLTNFIAEIRTCTTKGAEKRRVFEEFGKIRKKFAQPKLSAYDRKKYVWKLVYSYILGYDVPFGGIEAMKLISSTKYSEKAAGYIAFSILLRDNVDVQKLLVNVMRNDITSTNVGVVALALHCLSNIAEQEIADNMFEDIERLATTQVTSAYIRRKAYIALLKLYRQNPKRLSEELWIQKVAQAFFIEVDSGCQISLCALAIGLIETNPTGWNLILPAVIPILYRLSKGDAAAESYYHGVPSPWLYIKLLKILQLIPPTKDTKDLNQILEVINIIIQTQATSAQVQPVTSTLPGTKRVTSKAELERIGRSNIENAIFFEAVNLIVAYRDSVPMSVKQEVSNILGNHISSKDANLRCLSLAAMSKMAEDTEIIQPLKKYVQSMLGQLHEPDVTITKQALNLLFLSCDGTNWRFIVDGLLETIKTSDNSALQEEIALKVAILVEKNAPDISWYVDIVFKVLDHAEDCVNDEILNRVVQLVTGFDTQDDDVLERTQTFAAQKAFDYLSDAYAGEKMIKFGSYLLGEFGHHISDEAPGKLQFDTIHKHWSGVSSDTKCVLLTAYVKLDNAHETIHEEVLNVLEDHRESTDVEVQQRAVEFYGLLQMRQEKLIEAALAMMPTYSDTVQKNNPLIQTMKKRYKAMQRVKVDKEDEKERTNELSKQVVISEARSASESEEEDEDEESDEESEASDLDDERKSKKAGVTLGPDGDLKLPSSHAKDNKGLFNNSCVTLQGPLFESPFLSVSIRHQYRGPQGIIQLRLHNIHDQKIFFAKGNVQHIQQLKLDVADKEITLSPGESSIVEIRCLCLVPFLNPPKYLVQGQVMNSRDKAELPLSLPIVISKFVTPASLDKEALQRHWQQFSAGEHVTVGNVKRQFGSLDDFEPYLAAKGGFNLHVTKVGSNCFCGCGTLNTSSADQSMKAQSTPCILRLDYDPSKHLCKVAVRSPSKILSECLARLYSAYFFSSPATAK